MQLLQDHINQQANDELNEFCEVTYYDKYVDKPKTIPEICAVSPMHLNTE